MTDPRTMAEDSAHWDEVDEATELLQEQRFQDALYVLRDVIKKSPSNPYAYHFLGVALHELAQPEPARDAFRAALRLAPDFLGARVALAQELRMLGDVRGALREADEALRRHPEDGDALYAAGLAHAARGDSASARRYLNAFLDKHPELEAATEARTILAELDAEEGPGEDD